MNNIKALENKRVLVVGYGKSGQEVSNLVNYLGGEVVVYDEGTNIQVYDYIKEVYNNVEDIDFSKIDLTVLSPGVPLDKEVVKKSFKNRVETIGEVELAYRYSQGEIIGITGTNGKTTTTTLIGKILKENNSNSFVVGNIGTPFTKMCTDLNEESKTVIELSSYQLETIKEFRVKVAAILNLTEDHMIRHKTMEEYRRCKFNILKNQSIGDYTILNADDKLLMEYLTTNDEISEDINVILFSTTKKEQELLEFSNEINEKRYRNYLEKRGFGNKKEKEEWKNDYKNIIKSNNIVYSKTGNIYLKLDENESEIELAKGENIKLLGLHNLENIMVAVISTYLVGIKTKIINKVLSNFYGVEHRIEFVDEINDVRYYNDSKATNPDATINAVLAMNRPTTLLLGGSDKQISFKSLAKKINSNIKIIYAYGESQEQIIKDLEYYNKKVLKADNMKDALDKAIKNIKKGENILLSPACASFDEFKNFEERGERFKEYIKEYKEKGQL